MFITALPNWNASIDRNTIRSHRAGTPEKDHGKHIMGETNLNRAGTQNQRTAPSITVLIHEAIAAREGTNSGDCPPLFEVINPDALDNLFAPTQAGSERHGTVTFQYCEYRVTVTGDRTISLDPIDVDDS
jgi:Halobacterial output domain 1